jgi:hypothetical protein
MILAAFLFYGALCPAFLVWWAYGRGPVELDSPPPRNRNDRTSANGVGASFGPGFRPSDQAAARLGSSSINPSRGGTARAFNEGD